MNTQTTVTRTLVAEDQRLIIAEKLFGVHFPLQLEPVIYGITDSMSEDYTGGYWHFYTLSNGGFYMGPSEDRIFHVICQNQFEGDLSADALGITSCLYAYSHLSFTDGNIAREYARHYHRLREFMAEHPEVGAILGATD
jgi:Antirestriction protein